MAGRAISTSNQYELSETNEYSTRHRKPKAGSKTILPDLVSLNIGREVKTMAESIYHQMGAPTRKDEGRKKLIFCCLHFAYAELDKLHSPKELATMIGLDPKRIGRMIKNFSLSKVNYQAPQRFYTIIQYTEFLSEKISLDHFWRGLALELAQTLPERNPSLIESQPDLVAAAIITYTKRLFIGTDNLDGINLLINLLTTYVISSTTTIINLANQLSSLDNQVR